MFQDAFFRAHKSVFLLATRNGTATAFSVEWQGRFRILTAAHAVEGCPSATLMRSLPGAPQNLDTQIERVYPSHDLALLRPSSPDAMPECGLKFAQAAARCGMSACVIGYTITYHGPEIRPEWNIRILGGIVASGLGLVPTPNRPLRPLVAFDFDVDVEKGFSGSPVLDTSGALIGMICKSRQRFPGGGSADQNPINFTMAVGQEAIAEFLSDTTVVG